MAFQRISNFIGSLLNSNPDPSMFQDDDNIKEETKVSINKNWF